MFFNTSSSYGHRPHSSASRLRMMCSCETSTPHGPAACLRACVMDVSRRCECSDVARMACGASANDLRSRATRLRNSEIPGVGKGLNHKLKLKAHIFPPGSEQCPVSGLADERSHRRTSAPSRSGAAGAWPRCATTAVCQPNRQKPVRIRPVNVRPPAFHGLLCRPLHGDPARGSRLKMLQV